MPNNSESQTEDLDTVVIDVPLDPPRRKRARTLDLELTYVVIPSHATLTIGAVRVVGRIEVVERRRMAIPVIRFEDIDA